jgi:N-hydroxyarylamine O-acetyltransferase
MDTKKYLERINFKTAATVNYETLVRLHELHVLSVPFENIDIYFKRAFNLAIDNVYQKVVVQRRGGFCYELNSLFNELLVSLGFKSRIISSRIFDESGALGPEYDHMCVLIEIDNNQYLADVGYGDLFITPLEIKGGIQSDGRNFFKMEPYTENEFFLSMSPTETDLVKKYIFNLKEVSIESFYKICRDKQINKASYFVKNTICTKPTYSGRLTIFNGKLIEKRNEERIEQAIADDKDLIKLLKERFEIELSQA